MNECMDWFMKHPHLREHVRHIEIWLPVWGERVPCFSHPLVPRRAIQGFRINGVVVPPAGYRYYRANDNATLNDIFNLVKNLFVSARILTLEGGDGVKASLVKLFQKHATEHPCCQYNLPKLDDIETLVMRGAWNLMQNYRYWFHISRALPNLKEWHCSYARVQRQAYVTAVGILALGAVGRNKIRHIDLNLEGFSHNFDNVHSPIPKPILQPICRTLGKAAVKLETISFTGRVCEDFFRSLRSEVSKLEELSLLRSVDLLVKACCRNDWSDWVSNANFPICHALAGINNTDFNDAFHAMILEAIRALAVLPNLKHVRIRYMDLDWPLPLQNPYFELKDNKCTGLWSNDILNALHESRPEASFVELSDGIEPIIEDNRLVGVTSPTARPLSIQAKQYVIIAEQRLP